MTLYKCPYKSGDLSYHFLLFTSKIQEKGESGEERGKKEKEWRRKGRDGEAVKGEGVKSK